MKGIAKIAAIALLLAALVVAYMSIFTVHETKQAIVMQFGDPVKVEKEPGITWKAPWQDVLYYEKRVLNIDASDVSILLADQRRLLVDAFARYRIVDPLEFFKTVRTEGTLRQRLGTIINDAIRRVLGTTTLVSVLSEERAELMQRIQVSVNQRSRNFGIELVDVRIGRADLPTEISQKVFERMRSEREREAKEHRARGFEEAQRVRAAADREATVIRAEAQKEAEILQGEGEAARTRTLNAAFGQDAEFFNFYRSMQAYEKAFSSESTYMVLSPDSEFFEFFSAITPPAESSTGN
jgi:membrane protease subunit HflC